MANVSSFSGAMPVIPGGLVELGYSQITSNVGVNVGATDVISPMTVVCDGSPVLVEFHAPSAYPTAVSGGQLMIELHIDGVRQHAYWGFIQTPAATAAQRTPVALKYRVTPSAGSHTFAVKATASATGGNIEAGNSTSGFAPAFLRVSKIVSQNDGLKPFWKPPIVTQLPTLAQVGDQVVYAADATNGVYWLLQYDGLGTYPWKFIGGAPLLSTVSTQESTANPAYVALTTAGPSVTCVLPGDYDVHLGASFNSGAGNDIIAAMSYLVGVTAASDADAVWFQARGPGYNNTVTKTSRKTGVAASTALTARYKSPASATMNFSDRFMRVTPVRVSA